jgi:hypothetical protein
MNILGPPLQKPVFKKRDGSGAKLSSALMLSDRCRTRLNEAQLRGEFDSEVYFLSARGHTDELSLARRESEDRSKSRFPREGRAVAAQNLAQRAAARRFLSSAQLVSAKPKSWQR